MNNRYEKRLWLASVFLLALIGLVIFLTWAARHAALGGGRLSETQTQVILAIAELPGLVRDIFVHPEKIDPKLINLAKVEKSHWIRRFPAPEDSGYLLFSGVDPSIGHSTVQLIRIFDGSKITQWSINWRELADRTSNKKFTGKMYAIAMGAGHPLLLDNGDIIFNTGLSLVRQSPCKSSPLWLIDEVAHHSNELDASGAIWTPSTSLDGFADNPWLQDRVRDDALSRISIDGRVLEKHSFAHILRNNDLRALLIGTSGFALNVDPIHINQIKPALTDGKYWRKGDLLISARHLSSIFLYRPSTGKILWHQMGPWMNQHSVDFVDDHRISIFDNNVFGGSPKEQPFLVKGDINRVLIYDFETKSISQPFAKLLEQARPVTITEGRARVLPDGGLFIEESNFGRHLRFTKDRLLWSRVNDYNDKHIGQVSWSRYLTAEEASAPLKALASRKCQ